MEVMRVLTCFPKSFAEIRTELEGIDQSINKERSLMNALKMDRDATREESSELVRRQGFGTSDMLLNDFEKRRVAIASIRFQILECESRYKVLSKQVEKNSGEVELLRSANSSKMTQSLRLPPIRYVDRSPNLHQSI